MLGEGEKPANIAKKLDADKRQISKWAKDFCERGLTDFAKKQGGRHRENMSFEDEAKLLEKFKVKAEKGQVIEANDEAIKASKKLNPK